MLSDAASLPSPKGEITELRPSSAVVPTVWVETVRLRKPAQVSMNLVNGIQTSVPLRTGKSPPSCHGAYCARQTAKHRDRFSPHEDRLYNFEPATTALALSPRDRH